MNFTTYNQSQALENFCLENDGFVEKSFLYFVLYMLFLAVQTLDDDDKVIYSTFWTIPLPVFKAMKP